MILSVDPGKRLLSWALWAEPTDKGPGDELRDLCTLSACGISIVPPDVRGLAPLCGWHFIQLRAALGFTNRVRKVVIEQMQLNKGRDGTLPKAIATGNDLLELQAIAAYVGGRLSGEIASLQYLSTGTWKGSAPKEVTKNRVLKTLTSSEHDVLIGAVGGMRENIQHNLYDAIGIGLCAVKRYEVRPGSVAA